MKRVTKKKESETKLGERAKAIQDLVSSPATEKPAIPPPPAAPEKEVKVLVERFPDRHTLLGPAKMVRGLEEMVGALHKSAFMDEYFQAYIRSELIAGRQFVCRSSETGLPKSIYRLCTEDDLLELARAGTLQDALSRAHGDGPKPGKAPKGPRKARGATFRVVPLADVKKATFDALQKQGKVIFTIMSEHVGNKGGEIGPDELRVILEKRKDEIKTGQDVMKLFGFHMSQFYKKSGIVERVEPAAATDEPEEQDEERDEDEA